MIYEGMVDILRKRSKGYKVAEEERLYLGFLKGKEGCSMDIFSDDCLLGALAKEKHKNFEDYQEDVLCLDCVSGPDKSDDKERTRRSLELQFFV
ncbi:hypothetical protein Dsin_029787 [Dipteronia sinensis]|uniref:Uncharacterized protein n=1 Tax=Dipteronia sinensis TaxID=43782 RepID=A0AAE0DVU2_9ROSI|nr:hypothetical protein Dsin_029787 [Dipteronia sinensis]